MKRNIGHLYIISAPSGAGKTTLVNALLESPNLSKPLERIITYTTKQPRSGEKPGSSYHYLTKQEFEDKIKDDFFLEWSDVYENYYGSPLYALDKLKEGISLIGILDRNGAMQAKERFPEAILIWIEPPSIEELEKRLRLRGTDSEETIVKRLQIAQQEINEEQETSFYDHHIINDDFMVALENLIAIIG